VFAAVALLGACADSELPEEPQDASESRDGTPEGPQASDVQGLTPDSSRVEPDTSAENERAQGDTGSRPSLDAEGSPQVDTGSEAGAEDTSAIGDTGAPGDTEAPEDIPPPPLEPTLLQANTTWEVVSELVLEGDYQFAWDPSGQELTVQDVEGAVYFSLPGQVSAPIGAESGRLRSGALVSVGGEETLAMLASEEGLFVRVEDELVLSPLDALLPSPPLSLLTSEGAFEGWLWLAMSEGLWVFHEGAVYALEPDDVDTGGAALSFGAPVAGVPSLWGVNAAGTWALSPAGEGINLSAMRSELRGTSIASDAQDTLWVVDDFGDLHERLADGTWAWWRLPEALTRVEASWDTGGVWLDLGGELWFHYDQGYGPLETAIDGEFLGVDNKGRALVRYEDALWAIAIKDVSSALIEDPPTWSEDVEPIFIESCAPCHGKGSYAHPLYEPEQWIDEIDNIILMVTEPAWQPQMPLAPYSALDNVAVQAILNWRDAGFPE